MHARARRLDLWVIWVILSRDKNWWPETCQHGVTCFIGINPYIKNLYFIN